MHSDLSESAACNQVFIIALQDARFFTRWKICDESRRGFLGSGTISARPLADAWLKASYFPAGGKNEDLFAIK